MSEQVITSGIRPATSRTAPAEAHVNIPFKEALLVALAAGLGYGFDAYAVDIFGMLGPTLAHDLDVSIKTMGPVGSIFLVGYTIGTIGFGYLADRIRSARYFGLLDHPLWYYDCAGRRSP